MGRQASSKTGKEFQAGEEGVLLRIRIRNWKVEDQGSELHSQFLFAWLLGLLHLYCCYQTPDKKQLRRGEEEVI